MSSQHFSQSYLEARRRILAAAEAHPRFAERRTRSFGRSAGEELSTDALLFRGSEGARRLCVVSSALHGVEGFAGSAMQLAMIDAEPASPPDYDLLLIHAINPFGFHYRRRVNAAHLDLNRNAPLSGEKPENPGYERVRHLFNPGIPLERSPLRRRLAMAAIMARAVFDKQTVKSAFLSGQYSDPTGPFYGGEARAAEVDNVAELLVELAPSYDSVGHFDLHTGYGVRGCAHLMCQSDASREAWRELGFEPEPERDGASYPMHGELLSFLEARLAEACPQVLYRGVLLEFGTLGMELRAQLASMSIMIADNSMGTSHVPCEAFMELFNPSCPRWRHQVVGQALAMLRRLTESLPVSEAPPLGAT